MKRYDTYTADTAHLLWNGWKVAIATRVISSTIDEGSKEHLKSIDNLFYKHTACKDLYMQYNYGCIYT